MSLFIDTSIWYAAADSSDLSNVRAKDIINRAGEPLLTTDHVARRDLDIAPLSNSPGCRGAVLGRPAGRSGHNRARRRGGFRSCLANWGFLSRPGFFARRSDQLRDHAPARYRPCSLPRRRFRNLPLRPEPPSSFHHCPIKTSGNNGWYGSRKHPAQAGTIQRAICREHRYEYWFGELVQRATPTWLHGLLRRFWSDSISSAM